MTSRSITCNQNAKCEPDRRKRLGQYFTGSRLARLLSALAKAESVTSIIDPMGGSGDMLSACLEASSRIDTCVSIEIDPVANRLASERLALFNNLQLCIMQGNAFDRRIIARLPQQTYDLVITNPPYVRYQSMSRAKDGEFQLPNAVEVRSSLLDLVDEFSHLDAYDKMLFRKLISSYSGLSDLAVPCWILCAMLTSLGGRLAMVVPETWLSRDYAQIIQYLLLRWFRITHIIDDANAVWFPDAQVKTTLLVAERIPRRSSAFTWAEETYIHARLYAPSMTADSIVGNIIPGQERPELRFAELLRSPSLYTNVPLSLLSVEPLSIAQKGQRLLHAALSSQWLKHVERIETDQEINNISVDNKGAYLPPRLARWLGAEGNARFWTLPQMSIGVSQGLRTGANQFFYVHAVSEDISSVTIKPYSIFGIGILNISNAYALPVLRKQSELGVGYQIEISHLKGRVLSLQDVALPEDLITVSKAPANAVTRYKKMPDALAQLVRSASNINIGSEENPKYIPRLTAVRTNVRLPQSSNSTSPARFWYMLPPFAPRHRPDLFVARINGGHPKTILNRPDQVLIDANFSTLWLLEQASCDYFALLALLNSSWCIAAMELTGSVMGGGALKLEATHLRRLPIPNLNGTALTKLSRLGVELSNSSDSKKVLDQIDQLLIPELVGPVNAVGKLAELEQIKLDQLIMRAKNK